LLGALLRPGDVVLLTGDLGAGKTQFTKGIAQALGISQAITSPTFNLVHEYVGAGRGEDESAGVGEDIVVGTNEYPKNPILRHFDLYRLEDESELDDIDYFGLLEGDVISVVEWGDRFLSALPLDYLLVALTLIDERTRMLRFEAAGTRGLCLLASVKEALHVKKP
jgi:tRNA threonylcarbamoyladenosine biosynthesis protein TsaE